MSLKVRLDIPSHCISLISIGFGLFKYLLWISRFEISGLHSTGAQVCGVKQNQ